MAKASAARCEWLTSARSPQQQLDTNMVLDISRMKEDQSQIDVASVEKIHSPFEENINSDFSSSNMPTSLTMHSRSHLPSLPENLQM